MEQATLTEEIKALKQRYMDLRKKYIEISRGACAAVLRHVKKNRHSEESYEALVRRVRRDFLEVTVALAHAGYYYDAGAERFKQKERTP